jgi:hypothetical protein
MRNILSLCFDKLVWTQISSVWGGLFSLCTGWTSVRVAMYSSELNPTN